MVRSDPQPDMLQMLLGSSIHVCKYMYTVHVHAILHHQCHLKNSMNFSLQKVGRERKRTGRMMIIMTVMMIHFWTELETLKRKGNKEWRKQENLTTKWRLTSLW